MSILSQAGITPQNVPPGVAKAIDEKNIDDWCTYHHNNRSELDRWFVEYDSCNG